MTGIDNHPQHIDGEQGQPIVTSRGCVDAEKLSFSYYEIQFGASSKRTRNRIGTVDECGGVDGHAGSLQSLGLLPKMRSYGDSRYQARPALHFFPERLPARPRMLGVRIASSIHPIRARSVLRQDFGNELKSQLLLTNHLHATQHGESKWKGLSEIAATESEHFPEKFGGDA
jgi:hypothetical protein